MTEEPNTSSPAPEGGWDVFLSYRVEDEPLARALRGQLKRRRPGLTVWAEKSAAGIGNSFSQDTDEALARSARVIMLWTPRRLVEPSATELESLRALALQKPILNVSAGLGDHVVPSPFARFSTHDIAAIAQLAGRTTGWGQPPRPEIAELDRQVEPVARWIDQTPPADPGLAADLLSTFTRSAGWSGSAQFEAVAEALARGDRSSVVEMLLNAGYDTSRIDQIISPVRLRLADTRRPRPPWGAWRLEPRPALKRPESETAWPWALLGFVACGLLALTLWLLASVMGGGDGDGAAIPVSTAGTTPTPEREPLPLCQWNRAGEFEDTPCRMAGPLPEWLALPRPPEAGDPSGALEDCERGADGRVMNTPCTLRDAAALSLQEAQEGSETDEAAEAEPERPPEGAPEDAPEDPQDTASADEPVARDDTAVTGAERNAQTRPETVPPSPSQKPAREPQTSPEPPATAPAAPARPRPQQPAASPPEPIEMPADLDPCEARREVPCRLTVSKTGLWTLSEIAAFYYGTPRAWCRIYRANPAVFAGRGSKRGGDEACISLDDVIDLPPPTDSGSYSLNGCPARANPSMRCE